MTAPRSVEAAAARVRGATARAARVCGVLPSSETLLVIFVLNVPYLFFCARAERLAACPAACVFFGARGAAAGPVEARVMR